MKTYSIAEINDLDHGIPISRFEGRIKKVFEQKQGEGQYGTWYLQNLIVEDGQQEITVTWTGDDPFHGDQQGEVWSFETGYDKKEKPVGIVRDIRTVKKTDKTTGAVTTKRYEGVKVDNRSKIKRESNGSAFQRTKAAMADHSNDDDVTRVYERKQGETIPEMMARHNQEARTNAPQSPPHAQQVEDGVTATRKHLMQSSNLLVLCIRAVENAVAPHQPVVAQTSEQFQSDVAKLFIEASSRRTTDGVNWWSFIDRMPTTPLPPKGKHSTTAKPIQKTTAEDMEVPF